MTGQYFTDDEPGDQLSFGLLIEDHAKPIIIGSQHLPLSMRCPDLHISVQILFPQPHTILVQAAENRYPSSWLYRPYGKVETDLSWKPPTTQEECETLIGELEQIPEYQHLLSTALQDPELPTDWLRKRQNELENLTINFPPLGLYTRSRYEELCRSLGADPVDDSILLTMTWGSLSLTQMSPWKIAQLYLAMSRASQIRNCKS